jgi:predicted DNA-binding transcriptional regulator YafY
MSETASRLLELLSLLQARRDWPGNELADRLAVSGRTIRRDIDRLRQLAHSERRPSPFRSPGPRSTRST